MTEQRPAVAANARLFFALWPDEAVRRQLSAHADSLASHAKPVPAANLHLTLAFLGSVSPHRIDQIHIAAERVAARAFELRLDQLGGWKRQGIVWLGSTQPCAALSELSDNLRSELSAAQVSFDAKPFRAHVTVARKLTRAVATRAIESIAWPVETFVLMRSTLEREAARYEQSGCWSLR